MYSFEYLFSILWGLHVEVGLLGHMVVLFNFLKNRQTVYTKSFSENSPFEIPLEALNYNHWRTEPKVTKPILVYKIKHSPKNTSLWKILYLAIDLSTYNLFKLLGYRSNTCS